MGRVEKRVTRNNGGFTQWVWQHCNNLNYSELGLYWFTAGSAYLLHSRMLKSEGGGTPLSPRRVTFSRERGERRVEEGWEAWTAGNGSWDKERPCSWTNPNLPLFLHYILAHTPTFDLQRWPEPVLRNLYDMRWKGYRVPTMALGFIP